MQILVDSGLTGKVQSDYGQMMQRIAIYDLDRTITRFPTYIPFLAYALWRRQPWRIVFLPLALTLGLGYAARLIGRARLKEINFRLFLGPSVPVAAMDAVTRGWAGRNLARNTLRPALDRIAADRAEGYHIVIATASFGFYISPYAMLLGIDDVVGTGIETRNGHFLARISGGNCYGPAKLDMIRAWLASRGITREDAHIRFYTDHVSDRPCLEWADEGFATNPHPALRELAAQRGWPVLDWKR